LASPKEFYNFVGHSCNQLIINIMGKGDKKSKRGKILMGSYGVRRPRKTSVHQVPVKAVAEEKPVKAQKEKPAGKPKAVVEEVKVEAPLIEAPAEEIEKPAKKKPAPKAKAAKKEEPSE
jgi:30S ribosomal protein S31